jgi:hypothetical protein
MTREHGSLLLHHAPRPPATCFFFELHQRLCITQSRSRFDCFMIVPSTTWNLIKSPLLSLGYPLLAAPELKVGKFFISEAGEGR